MAEYKIECEQFLDMRNSTRLTTIYCQYPRGHYSESQRASMTFDIIVADVIDISGRHNRKSFRIFAPDFLNICLIK